VFCWSTRRAERSPDWHNVANKDLGVKGSEYQLGNDSPVINGHESSSVSAIWASGIWTMRNERIVSARASWLSRE
jgi:hypothetical protein